MLVSCKKISVTTKTMFFPVRINGAKPMSNEARIFAALAGDVPKFSFF